MSTVISPVTQTAETLVKAAVNSGGRSGPGVATGSDNSAVPTSTVDRNAIGTIRAGCVTPGRISSLVTSSCGHAGTTSFAAAGSEASCPTMPSERVLPEHWRAVGVEQELQSRRCRSTRSVACPSSSEQ